MIRRAHIDLLTKDQLDGWLDKSERILVQVPLWAWSIYRWKLRWLRVKKRKLGPPVDAIKFTVSGLMYLLVYKTRQRNPRIILIDRIYQRAKVEVFEEGIPESSLILLLVNLSKSEYYAWQQA